jgi:hypothetical protein
VRPTMLPAGGPSVKPAARRVTHHLRQRTRRAGGFMRRAQ